MHIVFASANKNKIQEISALIPSTYKLLSLEDIGITKDIPETGLTIKDNSEIKARYVAEVLIKKKLPWAVIADDSGLEVEALNGEPGVYSARYAGIQKNDTANNKKLLDELAKYTNRKAIFVTTITLILNNQIFFFNGAIIGTIALEPKGIKGFGYDPLFIPQGYQSTFAELEKDVKNKISHRAIALKKVIQYLNNI
jgi:XTP/dITP diphosphohydrolase